MATPSTQGGTLAGTAGGTLLTILFSLRTEEVAKTVILACIGAITSFLISLVIRWLVKKIRTTR